MCSLFHMSVFGRPRPRNYESWAVVLAEHHIAFEKDKGVAFSVGFFAIGLLWTLDSQYLGP